MTMMGTLPFPSAIFRLLVVVLLCLQSSAMADRTTTTLATKSLQLQSQIFRSVIANYLSRPDDVAALETNDRLGVNPAENETDSGLSTFDDSSIHLRVLRSADHHQRHRVPPSPPSPHHQHNHHRPANHLPLAKSHVQLIEEFGEETTATIEVIQTRTPFNVTNGQLIMRDLPMVERRSIPQFGGMVTLYTRTNPLRLLYYGNWCGSGGMGPPLDDIDKCCMTHDKCYGETEKQSCSSLLFQKPYTVHYAWRWIEEYKQAVCLRTGDRCADLTCECDRKAASCFAKHMIDVKLQGNRLRRNRKRVHPLRAH